MKKEVTDMAKYDESEEIHDLCVGCDKVFEHTFVPEEGEAIVILDKCLSYCNPASKWPAEGQKFAMHTVMVRERAPDGKPLKVEAKELPIVQKYCPLASHFEPPEIVKATRKILAGQQKQGRG